MRLITLICFTLLWGMSYAFPVLAQDVPDGELGAILSEQKAATEREAKLKAERVKIQDDISGLSQKLGNQIKSLSQLGAVINSAQNRFDRLDADYELKKTALNSDEQSLSKFLGYIQKLERQPPSPALTSPRSALKASQSALLIQSLTAEFDQRSRKLEEQIKDISSLRDKVVSEQTNLTQKQSRLRDEEAQLKALVTQRRKKAALIADEEKKARQEAARLAAKAADLKQLLKTLEDANKNIQPRVKPKTSGRAPIPEGRFTQNSAAQRFTTAKGQLLSPVIGRLIRKYGGAEQGLTLSASARSDVKAPHSGRVEFSGAFKNYNNVVILNVGEGYFLLLTGLSDTIVDVGDSLKRGQIVGALPSSRTGKAEIYIELRKGGSPINPAPWFGKL